MSDKKIIAVVGATGAQGGGLVRVILADPDSPFTVRALTRDVDSPKARDLAAQGVEVVRADLDDEASVHRAFSGAYGAFVVTNFWEPRTPEQEAAKNRARMEIDQAQVAARAARAGGLRHVVWSTLEDTRPHFTHLDRDVPTVLGEYKVPHFDAKATANAAFTSLGVPTTFLQTTFYYEACTAGWGPHRDADGKLVLTIPMADKRLSMIAAQDIGRTALAVLTRGAEFIGRTVSIAGEHATGAELAAKFSALLGEQVTYRPQTYDEARAAGGDEIANTFEFFAAASAYFTGARNLDAVRELNPELESLDSWLAEHRADIAAAI